jgi:hypothetical protein
MNTQRWILSLMAIALTCVTASLAQQVKTDYDRSAAFSQFKTYSWEQVNAQNPLWVNRIKAAVNSALTSKGWTQVESGGDVSIMAMEMNETHKTLDTYYDGFGGGCGESTTTENTYRVGTLVIDLYDSSSKNLIWRGSLSDVLSNKSNKNIKNLDKGVEKLFNRFPPSAKNG